MNILVAGAGGAIGGHLVKALVDQGHGVRAADIKPKSEWWQVHPTAHNYPCTDLAEQHQAEGMVAGADQVYDLAERMGGIGYIESNRVNCSESIEIGMCLLRAAAKYKVQRFFFSSSACVYPTHLQASVVDLHEDDAWPAQPEVGYGHSKLYMEELCRLYYEERGLETRVARYHNIYGSPGSWNDGKEKSPAAICRKVSEAVHSGNPTIPIWGDGTQVRSYLHVSDCIEGTLALMNSDRRSPLNIGSDDAVSINELVSIVEAIAGVQLERTYDLTQAQGVGGRNADIGQAKESINWEPTVTLAVGLSELYHWIDDQISIGTSGDDTAPQPTTTGGYL